MKYLIFIALVLESFWGLTTTYFVGSSEIYSSPNALYLAGAVEDGDTIFIQPETYVGTACLAVWQSNNLYIKGLGDSQAHMKAAGEYIWGKGTWVLAGNDITVENIEFSEASVPDHNGAGIRVDGAGLSVYHCFFHDNENGILTNNTGGNVTIEHSEFDHNGYGEGYTHNVYVGHVDRLTFKFNYSHHAYIGHNLKSRAAENFILYNRIMDEETGESSRLIDLPNGGFSIVMGNLLMQGNAAPNNNMFGYGLEGLDNSVNELYCINNTFVNKRAASCLFFDVAFGTSAVISNNIIAGNGTLISGEASDLSNNLTDSMVENFNFTDESNYDYHLSLNSPAIDMGSALGTVGEFSLIPDQVYIHPVDSSERVIQSAIDVGAYEYLGATAVVGFQKYQLKLYPNPCFDKLILENVSIPVSEIGIYNLQGQNLSHLIQVNSDGVNTYIDTQNLTARAYLICIPSLSFKEVLLKY